jgi:hypothetical protein
MMAFQFDHDARFDEEVGTAGADVLVALGYVHFLYAFETEAGKGYFQFQGALVDDFLEADAKGAMDGHGEAYNGAGKGFVYGIGLGKGQGRGLIG